MKEPTPEDSDADIAYRLEQWLWDGMDPNFGDFEAWEGALVREAIRRLRRPRDTEPPNSAY